MYTTQNSVIIVAGGQGLRMGADIKKQYLCIGAVPVLTRTLMAFDSHADIDEIFLVIPQNDYDYCKSRIIAPYGFKKKIHIVAGGKQRQDSVLNGLEKLKKGCMPDTDKIVLIHDGVRPFVGKDVIRDCILGAQKNGACVPGVKITDTVKQADEYFCVEKTIPRQQLYCVQTPQAFRLELILSAFEYAEKTSFTGTDDASIVEHAGQKVMISKGSKFNIKITTPEDLVIGESFVGLKI